MLRRQDLPQQGKVLAQLFVVFYYKQHGYGALFKSQKCLASTQND